jgi:heme/copper-type cytochrome/quinol oxidase subunit 3
MQQRVPQTTPGAASVAQRRQQLLPNGVLGMLIFVIAEVMLFAGMISAFMIVRANAVEWPPPGQPRLPVGQTAFNTAALLLSGVALWQAGRAFKTWPSQARAPLAVSIALGAVFVIFQGLEWISLLGQGLTLTSSAHGSFFYLIVGSHALHAVAALGALTCAFTRLSQRRLRAGSLWAVSLLWYFVVGIWPILYLRVYL